MDAQNSTKQKKQTGPNKPSTGSAVNLENGSKNEVSPGSMKKTQTYAEAIKMGKLEQRNNNKLQILDATIQQLIVCLQNLKRNRRFIRIQSRRKWKQQKKLRKEIQRGKETVLNLSKRVLNNAEHRLLGKGLKFCPNPSTTMKYASNKMSLNSPEN